MAEQISEREIGGVRLVTLELSAGELEVLTSCLTYVLDHVDQKVLEQLTGAYSDEVAAIRDDLCQLFDEEQLELSKEPLIQEAV